MSLPNDSWLRCFHTVPDPVARLVCCPHAGGSASTFFPLSRELADRSRVEVVAVQYPGRQDRREAPMELGIRAMAARIAEELSAWADRPLSVFGHSMGATVGYELARVLKATASPGPDQVIVSGQRSPELQSSRPVAELDDDALVRELALLGGTSPELLDDSDVLQMFLPPLRADYAALRAYRHRPEPRLSCPVTALVGASDPKVTVEEAAGWSDVTHGPFDLRIFEGGHFYLDTRREEFTDTVTGLLASRPLHQPKPTPAH
ncbi:alpha/beta fold hydrolase [Streptomyces sp. TG1A-8]|uniref:thioesterase II family protein n=1 Tax=Streptomyces sp. TG1A-8 TaxID=3051385 RepID=UPI00265BB9D3|nr:alpha/beta fold hydrolase [Streptomyces sp. TG1A-8]MDO0929808.1 alpha/beta fold hydrolase [Streptomyces sp. TG1A-8]